MTAGTLGRFSPRGAIGAGLFLAAVPAGALAQAATGINIETVIHWGFAVGAGFVASAVPAFPANRWMARLGITCASALSFIFGLQGVSDLTGNEIVRRFAFDYLGQDLEGWMLNGVIAWCFAALLAARRDRVRAAGLVVVSVAAAARLYAVWGQVVDPSTEIPAVVKLLYVLPFAWLLIASIRSRVAG